MELPIAIVLENSCLNYLPNVVSAIVLLVIGLVVGKVVGRIVKEAILRIKIEKYVGGGKKLPISLAGIFSVIVKWWIYLAFITAALSTEVLGVTALAQWMATINAFIPKVIGAAIIMVVGYLLGGYIGDQIKKTPTEYAPIISRVTFFFIVYVAIAMALPVLGIPAALVNNILLIVIGSVGLGIAIALGLGLKDTVADLSKEYLKKAKAK